MFLALLIGTNVWLLAPDDVRATDGPAALGPCNVMSGPCVCETSQEVCTEYFQTGCDIDWDCNGGPTEGG